MEPDVVCEYTAVAMRHRSIVRRTLFLINLIQLSPFMESVSRAEVNSQFEA
jgi:hypothetical protein